MSYRDNDGWVKVESTPRCIRGCAHVELSDYAIESAEEDERKLIEQKGFNNHTTLALNSRRDLIGSLGQNSILDLFQSYGMAGGLEMSPYFNPLSNQDEFDFKYRGSTFDVKSSPMRKFKYVTTRSTFLISDHQEKKHVDFYCFAQVDLDNMIIHYPGVIRYEDFWTLSEPAVGEWVKSPAHIISAQKLTSIEEIIV